MTRHHRSQNPAPRELPPANSSEVYSDARDPRIRQVRRRLELGVYETGAVRDELAWRLARALRDIPIENL
jgi:hypothetical protein